MNNPENALLALNYFQQRLKPKREVILDNVTLKVCRKGKDMERAEKLFDEILQRGVNPDNVTFSTMISCSLMCSLLDKAVEWFEKIPGFGCNPDDVTYSAMIDAYGRVGKVEMAFSLYDRARTEKRRIDPVTFSTFIKIHGQSGNFDGCLNVYEELKAIGAKPNLVIYNTLLDAMGRARRPWQAKKIYRQMISKELSPNWVTYATLLRAYGIARYCDDALNVYKEMKEKGLELNLVNCIERADEKLGYVLKLLVEKQESSEKFNNEDSQLFNSIGSDVKKAYSNCLIDLCVNLNLLERACELLDLGITLQIYIGLQSRSQTQWSLYLNGLSLGAALTALHVWINDLSRVLESGEELLPLLGINTGYGKYKYSDKGLAGVF
ncbi:hypothetical protein ACFX2I_005402 [Malus domestica]